MTSYPGRTSPVKRGKWILEQLLSLIHISADEIATVSAGDSASSAEVETVAAAVADKTDVLATADAGDEGLLSLIHISRP